MKTKLTKEEIFLINSVLNRNDLRDLTVEYNIRARHLELTKDISRPEYDCQQAETATIYINVIKGRSLKQKCFRLQPPDMETMGGEFVEDDKALSTLPILLEQLRAMEVS